MKSNIYYVYQYYDPIRNEPFYIGKGKNERCNYHLHSSSLKKKHPFIQRIKWIRKQGKEPIITLLKENLTEEQALKFERKIITKIGRKDLDKGTLLNLTNGGEGASGHIASKESREKMRKARLGKKLLPESKEKVRLANLGKIMSEETREKLRKKSTGNKNSLGVKHSVETRENMRLAKSEEWKIIFPDGHKEKIFNLAGFCRDNKLNKGHMCQISKGTVKHHKGFRCFNITKGYYES